MKILPNTTNIEILTPTGFVNFAALSITDPEYGLCFSFEDDTKISVSMGHLFVKDGAPTLASSLAVGDKIDSDGGKKKKIIEIKEVSNVVHIGPLHVEDHIYKTPDNLIHHNCEFIGSSTTLVSPEALSKLEYSDPITYKYGYSLSIYEEPQEGAFYILGVDSASGSGKDYSVIQVIRIHSRGNYEQVAVYADNNTPPGKFARILKDIAEYYNDALAIVENNEVGRTVADEAWYTIGYDGIINTDDKGIGTRATKTSKLEACLTLKKFLEDGQLIIHDRSTIHEVTIFEEVAPSIFKAPRNKHDDRVSALYWACYGITQPQIDLDNLGANASYKEETPQTFWGDSMDDDSDFDFNWLL